LADWVGEKGYAPESGAREIRRVIQREIVTPLAEDLTSGKRAHVLVGLRGGKLALRAA
jgi:ATP-dependent Clp protease ATP-binding subunit ClpA